MESVIGTTHLALGPAMQPAGSRDVTRQDAAKRDRVRCECRVCGAHAYALSGLKASGRCGNCGSIDLIPLP